VTLRNGEPNVCHDEQNASHGKQKARLGEQKARTNGQTARERERNDRQHQLTAQRRRQYDLEILLLRPAQPMFAEADLPFDRDESL
jgi:hypothetical protein